MFYLAKNSLGDAKNIGTIEKSIFHSSPLYQKWEVKLVNQSVNLAWLQGVHKNMW